MKRKPPPDTFPLVITKGAATARIYRTRNRDKDLFTLAYIGASGRVRLNFAQLDDAKAECDNVLKKITRGDLEALRLTGRERQIFVAAAEALVPTGVSLDIAAREFATAFEILGHDAIIEAARFYKKHVESELPDITVTEAVAKFAEAKATEGMSKTYLKDIRGAKAPDGKPPSAGLLGRFATAFQMHLKAVMTEDLRVYLAGLKVGPVAKNNHRRLIVALFNFAKEEGWLRKDETTAAEAMKNIKIKGRNVAIFTPQEMSRLLSASDERFLPWVALIGFGGVRREELAKGLQWEAIDFKRQCIIVPEAIAKTGTKRKIEMPANLRAWLAPYRARTGAIFAIDPRRDMAKVRQSAKVTWKKNALRHSFGSYRMEATKNAGQVALEMGNSAAIVMKHYHEVVDAKDAKAYWAIRPARAGKVIALPKAALAEAA